MPIESCELNITSVTFQLRSSHLHTIHGQVILLKFQVLFD